MTALRTMAALELCDVVKDYAVGLRGWKLRALDHISLRIERGQVFGLLGPNGSGKSTALKVMAGLVRPSQGRATILGRQSEDPAARREIGYVPEAPRFADRFTGLEIAEFAGRLCGRSHTDARTRAIERLGWVGLADAAWREVQYYSRGMQQRLGLAQALVHDPEILLLDEPGSGLDPIALRQFGGLIRRLRDSGRTVLLTSHQLEQVEVLCDTVAILDAGRLRGTVSLGQDGSPGDLERIYFQQVEAGVS